MKNFEVLKSKLVAGKIISLEEVISSELFLLPDSNILELNNPRVFDFSHILYDCRSPRELDLNFHETNTFQSIMRNIYFWQDLFEDINKSKRLIFISEIARELQGKLDIYKASLGFHSRINTQRGRPHYKRKHSLRVHQSYEEGEEECFGVKIRKNPNRNSFRKFCKKEVPFQRDCPSISWLLKISLEFESLLEKIQEKARAPEHLVYSSMIPNYRKYLQDFVSFSRQSPEMTKLLSCSYLPRCEDNGFNTDEKLTALACVLAYDSPVAILSNDGDIEKMLKYAKRTFSQTPGNAVLLFSYHSYDEVHKVKLNGQFFGNYTGLNDFCRSSSAF